MTKQKKIISPLGDSFEQTLIADLRDPEYASIFISNAFQDRDSDPQLFKLALNKVVAAHGFQEVADRSSIGRTALYQMLGEFGNPTISNVYAIANACGLTLQFVVISAPSKAKKTKPAMGSRRDPDNALVTNNVIEELISRAGVSSAEVTKSLWAYIKKHNLKEPKDDSRVGVSSLAKANTVARHAAKRNAGRSTVRRAGKK